MVSFDIFDTLISRTTYTPYGIFQLMQNEIRKSKLTDDLPEYLVENFARFRIDAELDARRIDIANNSEEVTINDIYCSLARMTGVNVSILQKVIELEIQTEIKSVIGLEKNINELKKYLKKGERVILISDMYLPKDVIRKLLSKADPILAELPLFISCEIGKKKSTGELYLHIKKELQVRFDEWIHYGDNYQSDIKMASLWGIHTVHIQKDNRVLVKADRVGADLNIDSQLFLGTLRYVCANYELNENQFIGAFWGGGLLYSYVSWILQYSMRHHYKRLYFIARDGSVLKKIADDIIKVNQLEIQTKYIYGSRKAWRDLDEDSRKLLIRYFQQEIDSSDEYFALVDLQGKGISVLQFAEYIQKVYAHKLNVFFFQMYHCPNIVGCHFIVYGYASTAQILELFARAPHGATLGYKEENNQIVPVLAKSDMKLWKSSGLLDYIEGVHIFAQAYACILKQYGYTGISKYVSDLLIREFEVNLNNNELKFVCELPHNDTEDDYCTILAPKLSPNDIFKLYMWRTTELVSDFYQGNDLNLSLRRLKPHEWKYMQYLEKNYYSFWGKGIHRFKYLFKKKKNIGRIKIVIYAAGFAGRQLYNFITYETNGSVVAWTDSDYRGYQKKGYPVRTLQECLQRQFDFIVVAIEKQTVSAAVMDKLLSKGIDAKKIKNISEFRQDLEDFCLN